MIYVIEYFDGEFLAIRSDGDGAVAIRPIDLRMDHFIPPEDIRVGEAEDVFRAATDHGDLRFYLLNKWDAAGAVAPVMRHEDHIAVQIDPGMNQTILDGLRDIRRQQKTELAEGELQREGTVVGCIKEPGSGLYD